jgi:hypothetical protein
MSVTPCEQKGGAMKNLDCEPIQQKTPQSSAAAMKQRKKMAPLIRVRSLADKRHPAAWEAECTLA